MPRAPHDENGFIHALFATKIIILLKEDPATMIAVAIHQQMIDESLESGDQCMEISF